MAELNELEQVRAEKLEALRDADMQAYPRETHRTHTSRQAIEALMRASEGDEVRAVVAGRLRSIREMGKITFAHIEDGAGKLQLFFREDTLGEGRYAILGSYFDIGDFIEAGGHMFETRTGEVTLWVEHFQMLSKSVTPLPAAKEEMLEGERVVHSAFSDPEARYRERYVDLAVNPEVREIFETRARVINALRQFLDAHGFLEVETPILQPIYGGAAAQPFVTHHNQLHQDLYLRISFELYLKRLLVGGYERVYEIGRDFRNEGVSHKHNPEFTQIEFYMAYADYKDVMDLTEEMVSFVAEHAVGAPHIRYQGHDIDLSPPWKRLPLAEALAEMAGIRLEDFPTAESLRAELVRRGHQPEAGSTRGKLIDSLLGSQVEPRLIQPTILFDYPRDISPLAKSKPGDPGTVERFEGFIGGMEICNAFTELNDPFDQEARFLEMDRDYSADDEERHPMDEDYLRAMRYGMPPNGGFGMGVDRLTMLLTGKANIREVILFPHLRSKE